MDVAAANKRPAAGRSRLKVGEVKADDATITADVVTVDNSLVQCLKVDRRTGEIDYKD